MPLTVLRASMADLITEVRTMINDPSGASQQFSDLDVQIRLDRYRDDIRYEALQIAPSIVNAASTNNVAQTIFADYYSAYGWWENDVTLQGNNITTGAAWILLTPVSSDYVAGHWTFEANIFTAGTAPGQYPPVFATGKIYDLNAAAADLLEMWAITKVGKFDATVDGQTLRRSQLYTQLKDAANLYRRQARPRIAHLVRSDIAYETEVQRLFSSGDVIKGG